MQSDAIEGEVSRGFRQGSWFLCSQDAEATEATALGLHKYVPGRSSHLMVYIPVPPQTHTVTDLTQRNTLGEP